MNRATAAVTGSASKSGIWNGYNFAIANSASINSVIVRADFYASRSNGYINVRVSGDSGATYGPNHIVGGNTAEQTYLIDVTGDVAWTGAKLNNSNLRVNVTCFKQGGGGNPTCNLDWLPVNVTYTPFDYSVSVSPSSGSANQGSNATTNVTITHLSGISQQVTLSYSGCPAFATCSFTPSSGNPTYTSVFKVATTMSTPTGTYNINISGTGDGITKTTVYTLTVNPNCIRSNPTVLISPDIQSGTPGQTLMFTTNVTNKDNTGCGSSTFGMSYSIPSGWSGLFNPSTLNLSPGQSGITTFNITSAAGNTTTGNYTFFNWAFNNGDISYYGSDSAIYEVV